MLGYVYYWNKSNFDAKRLIAACATIVNRENRAVNIHIMGHAPM